MAAEVTKRNFFLILVQREKPADGNRWWMRKNALKKKKKKRRCTRVMTRTRRKCWTKKSCDQAEKELISEVVWMLINGAVPQPSWLMSKHQNKTVLLDL